NINCTGNYFRKDIYKLLEENEIHIVCILSIWPETFCYTLSESWQCNIPVITVDIGATGERVKNGGGILITGNNIGESTLKSIIELKNDRNKYESLCKTVKNIKLRDIGEMSKDYSNLYFSYMKNVMLDNKISSELILDALKNIDLFQTN
ncbi:glycosyltransferase, partial [Clostridioides difficile]